MKAQFLQESESLTMKMKMTWTMHIVKAPTSGFVHGLQVKVGEHVSDGSVFFNVKKVECRRVLKWTDAYGYYLHEDERAKKQFFEYLQGEAESGLERLHQCAEKELQPFLSAEDGPSREFNDFRTKLTGLTSVNKNYFENLVRALDNGLSDGDSDGAAFSKATSSRNAAGSSKGKAGRGKGTSPTSSMSSRMIDEVMIVIGVARVLLHTMKRTMPWIDHDVDDDSSSSSDSDSEHDSETGGRKPQGTCSVGPTILILSQLPDTRRRHTR